ncbi:ATP-dependent DNA helicase [Trichonephila clavipes]|nr:ATP-dependent DNA helicase [Trichonephila clavipes]
MYAKIETVRLLCIRLNETELRSEQYIHLRDAIVNDGNVNPNELGRMAILPSTFTGSPRHMHEYAQDAMTYVRAYGRPDLFVTFTCNPTWNEIKELLLVGQSSSDRHDITARVFKQKLKCLMDFIIKHHVFGEKRCWMYSIEWQKRGLPHAHILVWLINKITPDQIDQIISAEIPDKHIDPNLFDVVTKNMIHGPCGAFNNNSPCMKRHGSLFGVGNVAAPFDETNQYQLGCYISSNEAVWRILSFPIHERHPTVVHLAVHLENEQRVYFTADNVRARALVPPATTLTAFYSLCQDDLCAKTLLYSEVPKFYTWNTLTKKFQRRKQGKAVEGHTNLYSSDALGRLYTVHPNNTECFYLRLLLINIRGPISFQDLRTVNGQLCATYRQACQELNLLENDAHWDTALADASNTARPQQIRTLFAIILTTCFPSNPKDLWEKYKDYMSEDILHRLRAANQNPDIQFTPNVYNEALILIEDICLTIANKALVQLGMPASNRPANNLFDRDLQREKHYDSDELGTFVRTNLPQLILEQRIAYDRIMRAITEQSGGLFFIDAPGGTGKTFLLSLILATIRSQNDIALAIASSGIAATLLDGG